MNRSTKIALVVVALIAVVFIAYGYQDRHDELIEAEAAQNG
jgi:hypothetical protein